MASPNLAIPALASNSDQPEVVVNAAVDKLDESENDSIAFTITGNTIATSAEATENIILILNGTPATAFDFTVPNAKRKFSVENNSGKTATIKAAGSGVSSPLTSGKRRLYWTDGTDIKPLAPEHDVTGGGGGGGGSVTGVASRGALAKLSTGESISNALNTAIPWDSTDHDTDSIWSSGSPTRLTVIADVTRVRLQVGIDWAVNSSGIRQIFIRKNGGALPSEASDARGAASAGSTIAAISTPVLEVVAGDYFEAVVHQTSGGALDVDATASSFFSMQIVEPAFASTDNLLINPGFNIWQRGTTFDASTTPANNDDTYLADRWVLISDGNDIVDVTQDTDGLLKATVQTINKQFGFVQIVEAADCNDIISSIASMSVRAKATGLATLRIAVLSWTGTEDAVTSDVVATWAGGGAEPTWATNWTREGALSDLTLGASFATVKAEALDIDTASAKQVAVVLYLDDTDGAVSDTLNIEWVKLEVGGIVTPFRRRSFGEELAACQRYFDTRLAVTTNEYITNGMAISTTRAVGIYEYRVPKRVAPTIIYSAAADFSVFNSMGSLLPATSVGTANISDESFSLDFTIGGGGLNVGDGTVFVLETAGTSRISIDAEL